MSKEGIDFECVSELDEAHTPPFWFDTLNEKFVCSKHKAQHVITATLKPSESDFVKASDVHPQGDSYDL